MNQNTIENYSLIETDSGLPTADQVVDPVEIKRAKFKKQIRTKDELPILTIDAESGEPLTESMDGINMPANLSFKCVNEFVNSHNTHFEELQALCLGMATHIEKLEKSISNINDLADLLCKE